MTPRRTTLVVLCTLLAFLETSAATAVGRSAGSGRARATAPLVVIVLENKNYGEIVGDPDAPYINDVLIPSGTSFTDSHAIGYPSLPNYLALTAGATLGCRSNLCAAGYPHANLFGQLHRHRIAWEVWAASMPEPCARYSEGLYAMRHNPAVYYGNIYPRPCKRRVVAYPRRLPERLPKFLFIVPNLCQDMHDCDVARGDRWLSQEIPPLLRRGAVVLVTFDETSSARTRIATILTGPGVRAGVRDGHRYTHYGVLAGIQERFGLRLLRHAERARPLPI
ncbi:MAG: alkaline phosphatase family protein [Actinomycetota bacterium]